MLRLLSVLGLIDVIIRFVNHVRDEWSWFVTSSKFGDAVYVVQLTQIGVIEFSYIDGVFIDQASAISFVEKQVGHKLNWQQENYGLHCDPVDNVSVLITERVLNEDLSSAISAAIQSALKREDKWNKNPLQAWLDERQENDEEP